MVKLDVSDTSFFFFFLPFSDLTLDASQLKVGLKVSS